MKYFPTENLIFRTKLNESEVLSRLSNCIEPEKTFRFSLFGGGSSKAYEGQVYGQNFDIKRIIGYRNSFQPNISGIISHDFNGVFVKVKMRLSIFVIVFLCIWCGFVGIAFIVFLLSSFGSHKFNPAMLIPLGMLTFVYLLTMVCFKFESHKSKKDLQKILEADLA